MSTTVPPPTSSVPIAINKNEPQPSTLVHHDNPHQRMAYEAQHQANLMSDMSPLPRELLSEVESQKGKVPLAGGEHVDIQKVEAEHAPQVGHVMKEPNMFEKMGDAIKNVTSSGSSSSSSTMPTSTSIHTRDNIPHSALPNDTLSEIQSAKGSVPHAHHVDINKVEQQHQPQGLGHVQKEPSMFDKMGAALKNVTSSQSSSSSSSMSSSVSAKDNIPHSSLPNDTLKEIKTAKGSVPHAHHVDINKVEQQHQPAGLGHVQKDPNMLDKMGNALKNMTGSIGSAQSSSTSTSIHTRDTIPHSALPDRTLTEIQKAKGSVPHAHHVDINKVEQQHQPAGLGHVQETSTMNKMKQTLHNMAEKITPETTSSSTSTTGKYANVTLTSPHAHSSLPDYVLQDIPKAHVPAPTGHHVDVNKVEAEHTRRLSLGRVVGDVSTLDQRAAQHQPMMTERQPSLVDKVQDVATRVSDKLMGTSAPVQQHDNIPQSSLGPAVMKDIRQQHGHVPNAHHVPVIEHPSVPLGHVVDKTTKRD